MYSPRPVPLFACLVVKYGIENPIQLRRMNSGASILDPKVDIKILLSARDRDRPFLFDRSLDGIDDHVLDRATDLQGISQKGA